MSDTYTKLFSSITTSTIVSEPVATRWMWVTMLAAVKADGCVYGSIPGLARMANLSITEVETALACFLSPDPYSRTQENEGRRVAIVGGGWRLLNHAKYDAIRGEAERAEYKRSWDRKHRPSGWQRTKEHDSPTVRQQSDASPTKPDGPTASTSTSALKKDQKKKQPPQAATFALPEWIDPDVWAGWIEMRRAKRCAPTLRACALAVAELAKLRDAGHDPNACLDQSTRNAWTDVYPLKPNGSLTARGSPGGPTSKTGLAIQMLEGLKSGHKRPDRGPDAEAPLLGLGRDAGNRVVSGN